MPLWRTRNRARPQEAHQKVAVKLSNIGTSSIAVGEAAITALFSNGMYFGWYAIGLAIGFFGYLIFNLFLVVIRSRMQKQHWSKKIVLWAWSGVAGPICGVGKLRGSPTASGDQTRSG
jgi:hypothetical protein